MRKLNVDFAKKISRFEFIMRRKFLIKSAFYRRIFRGRGFEFETFRKYEPDDDASLIDWKASARANMPLVKQYVEEKNLKIFLIIDVGENMIFGSGNQLKNEVAAEISACLSHLIITSGDDIGYALFSKDIVKRISFFPGTKQYYEFERELENTKNYGGKSDMKKALRTLMPQLKNASAIFIISDFLNTDKECMKLLKELMLKHEVIGIMVKDIVDEKLPDIKNEVVVEDVYSGEQVLINPSLIKDEYRRFSLIEKRKIEDSFKKAGSDILTIYTNKDFIIPLSEFLRQRVKLKGHLALRKNYV